MGAESGISFNSAVRVFKMATSRSAKDIIPGLAKVIMPMPNSGNMTTGPAADTIRLPAKEVSLVWASRFFEEVHCIHWLYSSEQFHSRLQETYSGQGTTLTFSWVCSLYCIFALGSISSPRIGNAEQQPSPTDYLNMAKSLVSNVCDESDLDSVRAMVLLVSSEQACVSRAALNH